MWLTATNTYTEISFLTKKMELFKKKFNIHIWRYAHALRFAVGLHGSDIMVPRNSIQLLNINTTKFQVEREPV